MITQVIIRCARGGHKFVVLRNEMSDVIVFADDDPGCAYHRDLLAQYRRENGLRAECLGGGQIEFNAEKKIIRIWGRSEDFGREPDREATIRALKDAYPEFDVAD